MTCYPPALLPHQLTLSTCLSVLYDLSDSFFDCQVKFLDKLFESYYLARCFANDYEMPYPQSTASRIIRGQRGLPRRHRVYYVNVADDDYLNTDVCDFLALVASTAKLREIYYDTLLQLVQRSTNLNPDDKEFILASTSANRPKQLQDLLYKTLYVLIREPCKASA